METSVLFFEDLFVVAVAGSTLLTETWADSSETGLTAFGVFRVAISNFSYQGYTTCQSRVKSNCNNNKNDGVKSHIIMLNKYFIFLF